MSQYYDILYKYVSPTIGTLIVLVNALEIGLIYKDSKLKRPMAIVYSLNLAISDVVVGALIVLLKSMHPVVSTTWKKVEIVQEVYSIFQFCFIRISLFVSVFNLIALTLDRLWAITRPLSHRKLSKKSAVKICVGVWLLSVMCVVILYCLSLFYPENTAVYKNLVFPIPTYTAIIIFVICYVKIYLTIRSSLHVKSSTTRSSQRKEKSVQRSSMHEVKFVALAAKTVGVFIICWTPVATCSLIKAMGYWCGTKDVGGSFFTLALLNSLLNPFVYLAHMSKSLKNHLKSFASLKSLRGDSTKTDSCSINTAETAS
ncbi:lysophosphatidic acid receptor 3-like [Hydractinia symbiolongicarpus]|uniref:lysophosphatidic acid receptor 3-like n=1 Tax=Hydractinia symbiolongicarpus TaxID=13093 RepID=UPI002550C75F|nr:lysophosphatidic acid receptor 3-like [Hydractinia symbiolongicarpus]